MKVLAFDTETTGLVENRLARIKFQPHLIQFSSRLVDLDSGLVLDGLDLLVRPPLALEEKIVKLTGLTDGTLADAPSFAEAAPKILAAIESAPAVAAHNLTFDRDVINYEAKRLGRIVAWPRGCCSVEQTVHLLGRNVTLTDLHELLLGRKFEGAHSAAGDVDALVACLVEMRKRGML